MIKQRIYIETTLFNFYFDTDRGILHEATVQLFKEIAAGKYEAFTSEYVVDELKDAPAEKRDKMLKLIEEYEVKVLDYCLEAERIANLYVEVGIIPTKYHTDGLYIAIATINNLDTIVSLNFQHIVKEKTRMGTALINAVHNYKAIKINSPMEVIENEEI